MASETRQERFINGNFGYHALAILNATHACGVGGAESRSSAPPNSKWLGDDWNGVAFSAVALLEGIEEKEHTEQLTGGDMPMRNIAMGLSCVVIAALVFAADSDHDRPQYTKAGELVRPDNYREWVFLSSGFGMNYSPAPGSHDMFTNVFVPHWAYREFVQSGHWPDKSVFVVEERMAESRGSINKHGNFQVDAMGVAVEVKDSTLPEKWAYYSFEGNKTATANPRQRCFSCHEQHAAVEHTFVQFYPTLKPIAKKFGTYRQSAENLE